MKKRIKSEKTFVGDTTQVRPLFEDFIKESGITLIALIVMIVILVILSAVVIRGITGSGIISTTEVTAEDYTVTSYKEQIEQKVRSTVFSYGSKGQEVSISKIAEELNNETLWVKSAVSTTDTSINNEDILLTTTDGYVFQIYYSDTYGAIFVEYIGQDDGKEFPNIKARYEKGATAIFAETKGASRLELIYREEIKGNGIENPQGEQKIEIEGYGTGWYKIRAVGKSGKLRYAWVRASTISEKLTVPEITVTPEEENKGKTESGWYLGAVKVKIETDNPYAKEIRYRQIENGEAIKNDEKYTGEFTVNAEGTTRIIAWTVDEEGATSDDTEPTEIKIDSKAPKIICEKTSTQPQVGEWYKGDVEILIKGEDESSGIDGYKYMIVGEDTNYREKKPLGEEGDKIIVTREGITEIKIKVIDNAGHETEERVVIKKDTQAPEFQTIQGEKIKITNETTDGFTVNALAYDAVSGNSANGGQVTYTCYITKDGKEVSGSKIEEDAPGIFKVTGLSMGTTYDVRVEATDPAGNTSEKSGIGETVLNHAPEFVETPTSVEEEKTNTSIKLTMKAKDDDGDNLTYIIKYGTYNSAGGKNAYIDTKEISNVKQNVDQVIDITTGISNYTKYYFEVCAVDSKNASTLISEFDVMTYCGLATKCAGGGTIRLCVNCHSGYAVHACGRKSHRRDMD